MRALPAVTTDQMREVDRVMVEDLGIELLQMMENAGRNLALLAVERYSPSSVTVLAGSGGNGGGGLAAARHLANRGVRVSVSLGGPMAGMGEVPAHQAEILLAMGVPFTDGPSRADLIIDALIGYTLTGDPRGRIADLIRWANRQTAVLALDTPSGLDTTTGRIADPCIRADATMTLALPKVGLLQASGVVGTLYVADISVPPWVYRSVGLEVVDPFADGPVVEVG